MTSVTTPIGLPVPLLPFGEGAADFLLTRTASLGTLPAITAAITAIVFPGQRGFRKGGSPAGERVRPQSGAGRVEPHVGGRS